MLGSVAAAEDIAHDCFLSLLRKPQRFDPNRASLKTYLCAAARNLVWKQLRRRGLEADVEEVDDHPGAIWQNGPYEYLRSTEIAEDVRKAIDAKPAFAAAYKNMGSAYFAQKRFEDGYRAFQAALRLDPAILETSTSLGIQVANANAAELYYYFSKLSAGNKQYEAAVDFLARAIDAGFKDCARIAHEADFRALSKLPRFKQIVHSACTQQ